MAELGSYLRGQYAAAYDALVEQEQAAFEGQNISDPSIVSHPAHPIETVGGGDVPSSFVEVNPAARFQELFDERYGPEISRNERVTDVAAQRRSVQSSLTTMQSMIG